MAVDRRDLARQRWRMLAKVLRTKQVPDAAAEAGSTRQLSSFGLLSHGAAGGASDLIAYSLPDSTQLVFRPPGERAITAEDLIGPDNTGNVCIWPSEEVLAFYCVTRPQAFAGRRVLELGAGCTGLAGLAVAVSCRPAAVVLTDGNATSVEGLREALALNRALLAERCATVSCASLEWSEESARQIGGKFDAVICADCLFFRDAHAGLLRLLHTILSPSGVALFLAPRRGGTLDAFVALARDTAADDFVIEVTECYDDTVWKAHLRQRACTPGYSEDLHYPVLLKMTRRPQFTGLFHL